MSTQEVIAQKERFEAFMNAVNLAKIGERTIYMNLHDNQDGKYNGYCYLLRVLAVIAKVGGCYHHPDMLSNTWGTYSHILEEKAINAYINSLSSNPA